MKDAPSNINDNHPSDDHIQNMHLSDKYTINGRFGNKQKNVNEQFWVEVHFL